MAAAREGVSNSIAKKGLNVGRMPLGPVLHGLLQSAYNSIKEDQRGHGCQPWPTHIAAMRLVITFATDVNTPESAASMFRDDIEAYPARYSRSDTCKGRLGACKRPRRQEPASNFHVKPGK